MDRIENLIRGLDPVRAERESADSPTEIIAFPADAGHHDPGSIDSEYVAGADLENDESDESDAFSDDRPVVVPLRRRRRTAVILAGAAAAAVVAGAVVVGGSLGAQSPLPAASTDPTPTLEPSQEATADPSPSPEPTTEPTAEPTAEPSVEPSGVPTGPPADEGCRVEDVDRVMEQGSDFMSRTPWATNPASYTVIGCTDEWMSMDLSDEGYPAEGKDGGNAWFHIAKRVDGQWLLDLNTYGAILRWESALDDPDGRTPQEVMDQWFVDAGIPVELRPVLVGDGPDRPELWRTLESEEMGITYELPTNWGIADSSMGGLDLADSSGSVVANLQRAREAGLGGACLEDPVPWREVRSVPVSVETPSGPVSARFVLRLFEGETLVGATGLVAEEDPSSGNHCMLYNVITQPAVGVLSLGSHFQMSPHQGGGGTVFGSVGDAEAYAQSAEFEQLSRIAESIVVND